MALPIEGRAPMPPPQATVVASPAQEAAQPRVQVDHPSPSRKGVYDQQETRYHEVPAISRGKVAGVIIAVEGELEGEVFRILDGENRLGRSSSCEVTLPSEWISREHAKVVHNNGEFVIGPMTEKNPTIVNGEATDGTGLNDGDVLQLGRTTFRFRSVT